jgi:hypothetical protein
VSGQALQEAPLRPQRAAVGSRQLPYWSQQPSAQFLLLQGAQAVPMRPAATSRMADQRMRALLARAGRITN